MADEPEPVEENEADYQLRLWRRRQARKCGLSAKAARLFADESNVPLHDLQDLIDGGCDPITALAILL